MAADGLGDTKEALAALDRAISDREPVSEIYEKIIAFHERKPDFDLAMQWTEKASKAFGDADRWVPDKIRILRKQDRVIEATALTAKCMLETPDWKQQCNEANLTDAPSGRASAPAAGGKLSPSGISPWIPIPGFTR